MLAWICRLGVVLVATALSMVAPPQAWAAELAQPAEPAKAQSKPADQPAAKPGDQPEAPSDFAGPVLAVEFAGLETLLADPRDRPLAAALSHLPVRAHELLSHPEDELPKSLAPMVRDVLDLARRPGRFVVHYDGGFPSGGLFGYGVQLSWDAADEKDAGALASSTRTLFREEEYRIQPKPSRKRKGMIEFTLPFGIAAMGPRRVGERWRSEVLVGTVNEPDLAPDALPAAPEGSTSIVRARLRYEGLTALFSLMAREGGEDAAAEARLQRRAGIWGPGAMEYDFIAAHRGDTAITLTTVRGAKRFAEANALSTVPLSPETLRAVPADAIAALVMTRSLAANWAYLRAIAAEMPIGAESFDEVLAQANRAVGIDLEKDLVTLLDGPLGVYTSDATGGGGLGSLVVLAGTRDPARVGASLDTLAGRASDALEEASSRHMRVRVSRWNDGETRLWTLRFNGVPIPLELTVALSGQWVVGSLTPQGAVAAARQAAGAGDAGLGSLASITSARPTGAVSTALVYIDSARTVREGYLYASLLGSAVANFVRAPDNDSRVSAPIVPPLKELARNARPYIAWTFWKGDDLVTESTGPRSMLVGLASGLGVVDSVAAGPAGAILGFGVVQELQRAGLLRRAGEVLGGAVDERGMRRRASMRAPGGEDAPEEVEPEPAEDAEPKP